MVDPPMRPASGQASRVANRLASLEVRERLAARQHRRKIIRRIAIAGLISAVVFGTWGGLVPLADHLRTAAYLESLGVRVQWELDGDTWARGGRTTVNFRTNDWTGRPGVEELKLLPRLARLEALDLSGCRQIDPAMLEIVARLDRLRELDLSRLSHLVVLFESNLPSTRIPGTMIVQALGDLSRLETLILSGNRITDGDLTGIAACCPKLEVLELEATEMSDSGLDQLAQMRALRFVNLGGTLVTSEGVARLQSLRPDLVISLDVDPRILAQLARERRDP